MREKEGGWGGGGGGGVGEQTRALASMCTHTRMHYCGTTGKFL